MIQLSLFFKRAFFSVVLCCFNGSLAWGFDKFVNPGTMGPNALFVYSIESPWIPAYTRFQIGAGVQFSLPRDFATEPILHVDVPLFNRAVLFVDYMPIEFWRVSVDTQKNWQLSHTQGLQTADLRFGGKYLIYNGKEQYPSLAIQFLTKTTTGKGYLNRRFTNAPAYQIDVVIGYPKIYRQIHRFEFLCALGFLAWQQGANGQNDAPTWMLGITWQYNKKTTLRLDSRGYVGWQQHDKPVLIAASLNLHLVSILALQINLNMGIQDAALLDARLALEFRLPLLTALGLERI